MKKNQQIVSIIVVVLAMTGAVAFYKYSTPGSKSLDIPKNEAVEAIVASKSINSDIQTVNLLVDNMDEALGDASLSDEDRVQVLLTKGYTLTGVRSSSGIGAAITESLNQFEEAGTLLEKNSVLKAAYGTSVKFGLLYNFATNCFPVPMVRRIPDAHRGVLGNLALDDFSTVALATKNQDAAFKAMIDFAYTDADLGSSMDRSVISHRMFVTATYLASYYEKLSTVERADLRNKLMSDITKYKDATFTIFTYEGVPYHLAGDLRSRFHLAFANDIYFSFAGPDYKPSDIENRAIDSGYNSLRAALLGSKSKDGISKAMAGILNDGYHLVSAYRRYGDKPEGKAIYEMVIPSFKNNVFAYPENTDITKGSYNYTLSTRGDWNIDKKLTYELADKEKDLHDILKSAGVAI